MTAKYELWHAVSRCDIHNVRRLLRAGADLSQRYAGVDPLHLAIGQRSPDIILELVLAGTDPNTHHAVHGSALHHAISMADAESAWILANAGASLEAGDECGHSPLLRAAMRGAEDCVQVLLKAGASVNERTGVFLRRFEFPTASQERAFQTLIADLQALWGPATALDGLPGASWWMGPRNARQTVRRLQAEYLERGGMLLLLSRDYSGSGRESPALLPTDDKYVAIASIGIHSGDDGEILTPEVIDWLKRLERTHPFAVEGCGGDFLDLRFLNEIDEPRALATDLLAFCPDMIDHTAEAFEALVDRLHQTREVGFWWD